MKKNIIQKKSFDFALQIIELYKLLQKQKEFVLSKQLLRSGTSIGANIEEAEAGQSKRDFLHKMAIASKEARETRYWLKLLYKSQLIEFQHMKYMTEIDEIVSILTKIVKTTSESLKR